MNRSDELPGVRRRRPWGTIVCLGILMLVNWVVFPSMSGRLEGWLHALEFDAVRVGQGQWWRLLTYALVHWDYRHFLTNTVAFVVMGVFYEPQFGWSYLPLLLGATAAIGVGMWVWLPGDAVARGLSGVVFCQLALAIVLEGARARRTGRGGWLVAAAAALLVAWLLYKWHYARLPNSSPPPPSRSRQISGSSPSPAEVARLRARRPP